jgi:hypothetical protein
MNLSIEKQNRNADDDHLASQLLHMAAELQKQAARLVKGLDPEYVQAMEELYGPRYRVAFPLSLASVSKSGSDTH